MMKNLVLAGAGHAHMVCLAKLRSFVDKGFHVTVVGPSEFHYYSGMGPGMLGGFYRPDEIRFAVRQNVEGKGGRFVKGKVTRIDPDRQRVYLQDGRYVSYDVLSCNLGSYVPDNLIQGDGSDIYRVKPIEQLMAARERIQEMMAGGEALSIGIIGGGPSAVEIAGNVWHLSQGSQRASTEITVLIRSKLLPQHPARVRKTAMSSLKHRDIKIVENTPVREIRTGWVRADSGAIYKFDIVFVALGVKPHPVFRHSGMPTGPDGGMRVNRYLSSIAHPNVFGGGDCIEFQPHPLDKVGVYAVRQNPVLYHNLMAALEGRRLKLFKPQSGYLLIFNLGDDTGILHKWRLQLNGRLAFRIKDHIDRKFMRKFQGSL